MEKNFEEENVFTKRFEDGGGSGESFEVEPDRKSQSFESENRKDEKHSGREQRAHRENQRNYYNQLFIKSH